MERLEFELILATDQLAAEIQKLAVRSDSYATGLIRFDHGRNPIGVIVESIVLTNSQRAGMRVGNEFAPMADWIAVAMPDGPAPERPDEWIRRMKPLYAQTLFLLLVGIGPRRTDWRGWVIRRGEVRALTALAGIGRHAFRVSAESARMDSEIADRWSRSEFSLGQRVLRQLADFKVAVIGCSGVGCQIAMQLAALPIRRLGLVDGDKVELHNLVRMPLATEGDIGKSKSEVLARRIAAMRSDLAITVSDEPFGVRIDAPVTHAAQLLVTAVDRDAPRLQASYLARQRMIPHLDIGTLVTHDIHGQRILAADVRFLVPGAGCVRCVGGLGQLDEAEFEIAAPHGALPLRAAESWNARGRLGSLATINSVAAATGIQLWLDMLDRNTLQSTWHRIKWDAENGWKSDSERVGSAANCKICKKIFAA